MRILIITHYFQPDAGAAAVRLSRLAKLLHQRGHEVTVLTTMPHYPVGRIRDGYRGKFSMKEERDGLTIIRVWLWATESPRISQRLISQVSFMFALMIRGMFINKADVALLENQPVFTALAGWGICKLKGTPYIANVSDFWPEYLLTVGVLHEHHPLYRLFKLFVNITQRQAAGIIVLHEPLRDSIEARIGQLQNLHVIYNAVDLTRFQPHLDTLAFIKQHHLPDKKLILFAGTFGTHIDFDTMMTAAAALHDREDVFFLLVGTGGQREKIQMMLEQPIYQHVSWIGWLDHDQMPLAWSAAYLAFWAIYDSDLYRHTLQSKTFEAMASGTPAVIAIEGLTAEVIQRSRSGETVAFGDAPALAAAIRQLLDNPSLRDEYSRNARAYAETHFDPQKVADAYETILTQAAKSVETG